jgi:uncharacterized protein
VTPRPKASPKPKAVPGKAPATPTYGPRGQKYLVHNKIYSVGEVPAVACELPDIPLVSQKAVHQYSNAVLDCLQRAWKPMVVRAGVKFRPADLYDVAPGSKTACGTFGKEIEAWYCDENSGIYLEWYQHLEAAGYDHVQAEVSIQFVMAHEFGHHVQELVGISAYYDDRWGEATGPARLELMRRHELQASCFGSAFLGANRANLSLWGDRFLDYQWAAHGGDEYTWDRVRDHGSSRSQTAWTDVAFTAKSTSACNTWVVPAQRVS